MLGVPGHRALRQTGCCPTELGAGDTPGTAVLWEPHLAPKDRRRARGCRGPGRASGATRDCPRLSRAEVQLRASGPPLRVIRNDSADRCVCCLLIYSDSFTGTAGRVPAGQPHSPPATDSRLGAEVLTAQRAQPRSARDTLTFPRALARAGCGVSASWGRGRLAEGGPCARDEPGERAQVRMSHSCASSSESLAPAPGPPTFWASILPPRGQGDSDPVHRGPHILGLGDLGLTLGPPGQSQAKAGVWVKFAEGEGDQKWAGVGGHKSFARQPPWAREPRRSAWSPEPTRAGQPELGARGEWAGSQHPEAAGRAGDGWQVPAPLTEQTASLSSSPGPHSFVI